jgi:hypothetical protein
LDSEFQIEETEGLDQVKTEIRQVSTALNGIVFDNQVILGSIINIRSTPLVISNTELYNEDNLEFVNNDFTIEMGKHSQLTNVHKKFHLT